MQRILLLATITIAASADQISPSQVMDFRSQPLSDGQLIHSVQKAVLQPQELILLVRSANSDAYLAFIDRATHAFQSVRIDFRPGAWLATSGDKISLSKRTKNPDGTLADELVTVDRTGSIVQTQAVPKFVQSVFNLHLAPGLFADGDGILVNGEDGSASVFDGSTGDIVDRWRIPDDAVTTLAAKNAASKGSKVLLLSDVETTASGEVWLNLNSPIRPGEGAKIVKVRRNGEFVCEVRLQLPAIRDFATGDNPNGHMLPMKMAYREGTLVLADMRGVVAAYQVPQ